MAFLLLIVIAFVGYFILKEVWMRWKYDLHKIPSPPSVPLLGHALHFMKGKNALAVNIWLREWREKLGYPKVMKVNLLGRTIVFVCDINILRNAALPKNGGPIKGGKVYRTINKLLMGDDETRCMFTTPLSNTPYVKVIRKAHFVSFTSEGLRKLLPKQIETVKNTISFVERKRKGGSIDVQILFSKMTLDLILKTAMDLDLEVMDDSNPLYDLIINCGHHFRALIMSPLLNLHIKLFPNSALATKFRHEFKALQNEWYKIAKEIESRDDPEPDNIAFWANLKRVRMPETNDPLPFNLLKGELATTVGAGMDTTGHQLGWNFALLATNPQVVEKILDEAKSHGLFGKEARDPDYEDLGKLEYLAAVVKEGLRRMHTLVNIAARTSSETMILDKYRIPKNTTIMVASGNVMNTENEWEDHSSFKPERWLDNEINLADKYYAPFGYGARDCVGQKLAIQTMKLAILLFVRQYSFELVGDSMDSLVKNGVAGFVFEARNGVNLKLSPRAVDR